MPSPSAGRHLASLHGSPYPAFLFSDFRSLDGFGPARGDPGLMLAEAVRATAAEVDSALDALLPQPAGFHARVQEAMRYAVMAGGKRLRPFLVLETASLFGAPRERAMRVACAIECLHTYSLVHDDLPAMDDDDLRRGRPTTHRQFDEATAILAGDALLTIAFEILADEATHPDGAVRAQLVVDLARAGGHEGMIGGQMMDIEAPNHSFGPGEVIELQRRKTGALFEFSCQAGARLAQRGEADLKALHDYARDLGLAFQIADDLIDVTGTAEQAGKAVGKDQEQGKATLVSIYGIEGAKAESARLADQARQAVAGYGPAAERLAALPAFLVGRSS
jgi:farnesyl diphosphate synthase